MMNPLLSKRPSILYWYKGGCYVCHEHEPRLLAWAAKHGIVVTRLDIDDHDPIAEKFQVNEVPVTMIVRAGKELERIDGYMTDGQFAKLLRYWKA